MKEKIVNNVSDILGIIDNKEPLLRQDNLKWEVLLYRGQPNENYPLLPSIMRANKSGNSMLNQENNMIQFAKFMLPDVFKSDMLPTELLALMQHHGIPTRLLDLTENPLVALYFACQPCPCQSEKEEREANGELIIFKNNDKRVTTCPIEYAIADTANITQSTDSYFLEDFYRCAIGQKYYASRKPIDKFLNKTPEAGAKWIKECCQSPIFIYAPIRAARQRAQVGRYLLFPNKISNGCFDNDISELNKEAACIQQRLTIPGDKKHAILNELKCLGITEAFLFNDNIDIVCKSIKEKFDRTVN